jgi:hypothetical protein
MNRKQTNYESDDDDDNEKITVTASKRMFARGFKIVDNDTESDKDDNESDDDLGPYPNRLQRWEYESDDDYEDEYESDEDEYDDDVEVWKDIDGYDNYVVSSFGNVYHIQSGIVLKNWLDTNGYQMVGLRNNGKRKTINIHRLVAQAFIANPEHKKCVDHIDNNRTNNKVSNLRWATTSENNMNKCKQSNNTSGIVGVSFHKKQKKWHARITIDGKQKHLGCFTTLQEAKEARIKAVNKCFGDFAHPSQRL